MCPPPIKNSEKGYGSIDDGNDVEKAPLVSHGYASFVDVVGRSSSGNKSLRYSKRCVLIGTLIGLVAFVLIGSIVYPWNSGSNVGGNIAFDADEDEFKSYLGDSFKLSPIQDMGMLSVKRNADALPSSIWGNHLGRQPLPTNSWYLNLVSHRAAYQPDDSTRVYTVPYIVDTASPIPGIEGVRVHWPIIKASDNNIQMVNDFKNALCLGASTGFADKGVGKLYNVIDEGPLSPLGVGLEWGADGFMSTHIVRGMPYVSMEYSNIAAQKPSPTLYSYYGLASDIQIDLSTTYKPTKTSNKGSSTTSSGLKCGIEGSSFKGIEVSVKSHLHLHFINSDFTWIVFFSNPVKVSCESNKEVDPHLKDFKLSVVESSSEDNLVIRVALLNQCTTGKSTIMSHCLKENTLSDLDGYEKVLKANAHVLPKNPTIDFEYNTATNDTANIKIDWDATPTKNEGSDNEEEEDLLMFALPHHQTSLSSSENATITDYCFNTFHGSTCIVKGKQWTLEEDLGTPLNFNAPRPPQADLIPTIAKHLKKDIKFRIPENTIRGGADTYFSGKILARLARVIVIASELHTLAGFASTLQQYDDTELDSLKASIAAASKVDLPTTVEVKDAVMQLKNSVQAWLKSDAEAPYVYDTSWRGLVNCGCIYVGEADKGHCKNTFPDCPALADVNEDFGNGYYNDHHYHYGYHVYAAAVVAKFDPAWGIKHFDEVLLYIRDFANPRSDDQFFPQYRQKDWYLGSSWASGIISAENSPHGRNEESSSEAISAYEGVTLFGSAMVDAFSDASAAQGDESNVMNKLETATLIRDSGQLLTATEISATNRYWHVWSSDKHNNTYPKQYKQPVVGMLYDTMASFQTWFAPWAVVSYGIQIIPLTPVAETRDDAEWASQLYPLYDKACKQAGKFCTENGWSILQAGLLATTGANTTDAVRQALAVPEKVFTTDGGVGNSMSNTIWYIATRKKR